jgi:hypothetical protein
MTGASDMPPEAPGKALQGDVAPQVTKMSSAAERMRRTRARRREGVRWVLSVEIMQDRIDEWVSCGELSEGDGENRQAVAEFVEWLINNGDAGGRNSARLDPVAADAAFAVLMGDRSFGNHPVKPSVALPVVFGPSDEYSLSPRRHFVFIANERPGNHTFVPNAAPTMRRVTRNGATK